jgi:hypothetical protein
MPDFLERYGDQLRIAERRSRRRRSRLLRRGAVASLVVVAIAAPAVAVVQPWNPKLGRPKVDGPVSVSRAPVPRSAVEVLAVLRRAQTARDRRLAGPRLRNASSQMVGVELDGIRAVSANYALVPIKRLQDSPENFGPLLCLFGGGGVACGRARDVAAQGVTSLTAGPKHGTQYVGVVPDGVARVRFTPDGGTPVESVVRDNFYELRTPQLGPAGSARPPKTYTGPRRKDGTIAGGPMPTPGRLEWLDAHGSVVGPKRP